MSDVDSESSTDGDNNNGSSFFNLYLETPRELIRVDNYESPDMESDNSSDSDNYHNSFGSVSSESVESLNNTSEESDCLDDDSSYSSRDSASFNLFKERHTNKIKTNHSVSNNWCLHKELYNREIGQYNHSAHWGHKFYQSKFVVQKLKLSKLLKGHQGCVNSLDFDRTGEMIVSGSDDLKVKLWNWATGKCLLSYHTKHTKNIFQTKFLYTQRANIVTSGRDGRVIYTAVSCSDVIYSKVIGHHDRSCNKVAVHQDTQHVILSCGEDGVVKSMDFRELLFNENKNISNILHINNSRGGAMHLYGIDINPFNSNEFIVNGDDEYIRMYDKRKLSMGPIKQFKRENNNTKSEKDDNRGINGGMDNGAVLGVDNGAIDGITNSYASTSSTSSGSSIGLLPIHNSHITSAVYNYCGTEIVASYSDDDIYLFDVYGGSSSVVHSYGGHLNRMTVKGVNFYGPRSDYIVSGSDCGSIFIWDKKTEAIVQKKKADFKGSVNVLEAHPHIPTMATSGLDNTIKIWEPLNMSEEPNKKRLRMSVVKNRLNKVQSLRSLMFPE